MYRLAELDERRRTQIGWAGLLMGTVMLAVGVWWAHYAGFSSEGSVDYFGWVPRGWVWFTLGQLVAFAGSQLMIVGALTLWVLSRPMTWARAAFAAWVTWIELVLIFGVVPSEWLNLTQGPLEWTSQKIAFVIPPWLMLGNEVAISFAAIKDAVSGGYNTVMLVAAAAFAYQLQGMRKGRPAAADKPQRLSPYGRPLVKGGE